MATIPVTSPTADVVADTRGLTRAAWLTLRRSGIGGSDAATVLGLNPYATALGLYLDKLGLAAEPPETEAMWWGRALEPVVAERFAQIMPFTVHELHQMLRHRQHPFLLANIDRVLLDPHHPDRGPGILEVKAPGARQLAHWGPDTAPDPYLIQVQHYLAVTGFSWAYLAARVGNQQTYFLPVERDDAFITALIRAEADFWERVQTRRPPPLDGSDSAVALVKGLYPTAHALASPCRPPPRPMPMPGGPPMPRSTPPTRRSRRARRRSRRAWETPRAARWARTAFSGPTARGGGWMGRASPRTAPTSRPRTTPKPPIGCSWCVERSRRMKISETARAKAGATEPLAPKILAALVSGGDLALLTPEERAQYYQSRCTQLGLDPNTTPLRYMRVKEFDPKEKKTTFRTVLYAGKDAADALRALHKVRVVNATTEVHDDIVVVRVEAALPDGRTDIDVGAAPLADTTGLPLAPSQRANALMRAFTKAKRRVTLSITGAGLMDASDVDALEAEGLAERIHDPSSSASDPAATSGSAAPVMVVSATASSDPPAPPTSPVATDLAPPTTVEAVIVEVDALYRALRGKVPDTVLTSAIAEPAHGTKRDTWSLETAEQVRTALMALQSQRSAS
jgi:putative phage-type endonuclease